MENINKIVIWSVVGITIFMFISAFIFPLLKPWWAQQEGKSELAQAEQNRQIAILEARAKMESAELLAQAEIKRAEGVAKANQIIGESLKQNEDYLKYLWVTEVAGKDIDKTVVYIPTESNIPILEANRFNYKGI